MRQQMTTQMRAYELQHVENNNQATNTSTSIPMVTMLYNPRQQSPIYPSAYDAPPPSYAEVASTNKVVPTDVIPSAPVLSPTQHS